MGETSPLCLGRIGDQTWRVGRPCCNSLLAWAWRSHGVDPDPKKSAHYNDSLMYWGAPTRLKASLIGRGAQLLASSVSMRGSERCTRRPLLRRSSHEPAARTFFTQSLSDP